MRAVTRIAINTPVWALWFLVVELLPFFPGVIASALVVAFRSRQISPINGSVITNGPKWLWWFCNDEDGMESDEARRHYFSWAPTWFNMWWWLAVRNYAGNQRFVTGLYPPPVASKIHSITTNRIELTWQGWRHHLTIKYTDYALSIDGFKLKATPVAYQFNIGWKYYPQDANPDADYGWRARGCGFAARREKIT